MVLEELECIEETFHELVSSHFFKGCVLEDPHQENKHLRREVFELRFYNVDRNNLREVFIRDKLFLDDERRKLR